MKTKPVMIKLVAASLIAVPLTAIFATYTGTKSGMPLSSTVFLDLWALAVCASVAALGVWRVRPWGFFIFFGFVIGVVLGDLFDLLLEPSKLSKWHTIDALVVAAGVVFFFQRHLTAPYFNPKIRWWETPRRHRVADMQSILIVAGETVPTRVLDVSSTGCFVDLDAQVTNGEVLSMGLTFKHFYFESPVKVVRHSLNPKGVGLMFMEPTRENQREIKRLIKDLRRDGDNQHPLLSSVH